MSESKGPRPYHRATLPKITLAQANDDLPPGKFRDELASLGVTLPLVVDCLDPGAVVDATGRVICAVDVNGELSDLAALALAQGIVFAVNTCAGYRAENAS